MTAPTDLTEDPTCGWCGWPHPVSHNCGCAPCADCDRFHLGECR